MQIPCVHFFWYYPWDLRFSADQTPLEFDFQVKGRSWGAPEDIAKGQRQVRGAGPGLEKRQCTLQICLSADLAGKQPKPCLLMRGGGRISALERESYNDGVVVIFQKCAWFDREVAKAWVT